MSMPAVQEFRAAHPAAHVTLLVKPALVPLWAMHAAVDGVVPAYRGISGMRLTAHRLKRDGYTQAYVFPNSFRSALRPFLARIPRRVGAAGHWRRWMLTQVVASRGRGETIHQSHEYFRILGLPAADVSTLRVALQPPDDAVREAASLTDGLSGGLAVLMPGAARGGSKRWPSEHFGAVARALAGTHGLAIVLAGAAGERGLCKAVAGAAGVPAVNLAGRTSLPVLAALLQCARVVIGNDSGGMHLAAACGVPVVAVCGLTDPRITGPIGSRNRVVAAAPAGDMSRDSARESRRAQAVLRSIRPERVVAAAKSLLEAA